MKKVVLFALLLAAVAASVHAQAMAPLANRNYVCDYTNPTMGEVDYGISSFRFIYLNTPTDKRGIEDFDATWGKDNRKVTFAKPVDRYKPDIYGNWVLFATDWEFTVNPSGPQCKFTRVTNWGGRISFQQCSDGHSRICWLQ